MIFSSTILILISQILGEPLICHKDLNLGRPVTLHVRDACCPANDPDGIPMSTEIHECCCGQVFKKSQNKECCLPDGDCESGTGYIINKGSECKRRNCNVLTSTDEGFTFDCEGNSDTDTCKLDCAEGFKLLDEDDSGDIDVATCTGVTWDIQIPKTMCCVKECPPLPDDTQMDFMVVVDKSSSIGNPDFEIVKQFMHSLIDMLPLSATASRMSLITFNSVVETIYEFSDSMTETKDQLKTRIDNIVYSGRGTFLNRALIEIHDKHITNNANNRKEAKDVLLVITDGISRGGEIITEYSEYIKDAGVDLYAIGVGEVDEAQLTGMASEPKSKFVKIISNFDLLEETAKEFIGNYCQEETCESTE